MDLTIFPGGPGGQMGKQGGTGGEEKGNIWEVCGSGAVLKQSPISPK